MTQEFAQAPVVGCKRVAKTDKAGSHAKVYFTKHIDAEHLIKLYDLINESIYGKVAIKLHTGEKHGPNILPRELVKALQQQIPDSTIVETNTLYQGDRYTTEEHLETLKVNGWTFCPVDIMDAKGTVNLPVRHGKHFKEVSMGKNIVNYDSMLVLSHFKGHPMGGFGGALKQLSIGCASSYGKAYIHGAGEPEKIWTADHDSFLDAMADAASSVAEYFKDKTVFINVMKNMSVDCDCCAVAEDPCMADIGILASLDPIAVDQACLDLVYASDDPGRDHLVERIESLNGVRTVESAAALGFGTREYELVEL